MLLKLRSDTIPETDKTTTCSENRVFLQVPSSQKKRRNQTIEFSWGLYCLVVLFLLLYVICASVPTEGTVSFNTVNFLSQICEIYVH